MNFDRLTILIFLGCIGAMPSSLLAAGGAMSLDGKTAYITWKSDDELTVFDISTRTYHTVAPSEIGAPEDFGPVTTSKAGFLIGSAGKTAYAVNIDKRTSASLYRAPDDASIFDIAYNPKDGAIALGLWYDNTETTGSYQAPLVYVPPDQSQVDGVFCRRVDRIGGMDFDSDGKLYFSSDGDLWYGKISSELSFLKYLLNAERHCPLSTNQTNLANGWGIGARDILIAGNYLYVGMSGGHWASIIRLKKIDISNEQPPSGVAQGADVLRFAKRYTRYLDTVEALADLPDKFYNICGTRDGKKVLIVTKHNDEESFQCLLIENNSKPQRVRFTKSR